MGRIATAAVAFLSLALAWAAPASGQPPLPMDQGAAWVYEAKVKWTTTGSSQVKTERLKWTTEIISRVDHPGVIVAIVRGLPFELSWYEDGKQPGYSLLAWTKNRLYAISMSGETEAREAARRFPHQAGSLIKPEKLLLDLPLKAGKSFGGIGNRQDFMYCWLVEEEKSFRKKIKGWAPRGPATLYRITHRTIPDYKEMEFVPQLGIVGYTYRHHGTAAEADLHLVEFRPAPAPGPVPPPRRPNGERLPGR